MDTVKGAVKEAAASLDDGLEAASTATRSTVAVARDQANEAMKQAQQLLDQSKGVLDQGVEQYKHLEATMFDTLRGGIEYGIANPAIGYPVAGAAVLLGLPFTRLLLYRATIGRFRSAETVFRSAEQRMENVRTLAEDASSEGRKLQERLAAAQEEYTRGLAKMKATRSELQRLAHTVAKAERAAGSVLRDVREVGDKVEGATALRAEAADKMAQLRSLRGMLHKQAYKIASQGI